MFGFEKKELKQSKEIARKRITRALLKENIDLPPQLVELMRAEIYSSLRKYLNVPDNGMEMRWIRRTQEKKAYLEITTKIPINSGKC